jgi:uncharacterized protein YndB with AHSA1/START domain
MSAKNSGDLTVTTPSDREVLITRVFDAPRRLVFDAYTNPKHVPRWMLGPEGWTMPVCEIDLRSGGSWHFVWRKADGKEMDMRGGYRDVVPPERVVSTESWGPEWPETINTVTFVEENGKTSVNISILYPSKDARDAALKTGMKEGMIASYNRMAELLDSLTEEAK